MTTNKDFIKSALRERLHDVRARLSTDDEFGNIVFDVPEMWKTSASGCLQSLRALAAGEIPSSDVGECEPAEQFLERLKCVAREPSKRFELLTERYSYPLSFLMRTEESIREHLLERLMVQDRAAIERSSIESVDANEVLLRLNLLGLYAGSTGDLRYLDALNYYFELLPANWSLENYLLISFLRLYAKAIPRMSDML